MSSNAGLELCFDSSFHNPIDCTISTQTATSTPSSIIATSSTSTSSASSATTTTSEMAPAEWKAFNYTPSLAAAIIFIVLFLIVTVLHTYRLFRTRTWFVIPFVIGGFFEVFGYVGRSVSANQSPDWTIAPYVMQSVLLLVAPALFAASIYMILGRIIQMVHGEALSLIRVNWLTKIFVIGDVFSFLMQSSGAGMLAKSSDNQKMGENIIVGGLFVQIIFFALFIVVAVLFHRRMSAKPTIESEGMPWRKHLHALYGMSGLILIRSVFRGIEYIQGHGGVLLKTEVYLYVFDAALMWLVMVVLLWCHPSEINVLLGHGTRRTSRSGLQMEEMEEMT